MFQAEDNVRRPATGQTAGQVAACDLRGQGSADAVRRSRNPRRRRRFAAIILLTVISVVLFYAVELLEKRLVTWTP